MRIGQNPARQGSPAYTPKRVGVATLVYIPHREGYYAQALEILQVQLQSLRTHTCEPFDLFVFDNGSQPQVQQQLMAWQQDELVDWLFLSRPNLGKTGALNWILGAMPNELICYTDSDVYFRPGWLQESLKVLEAEPQAGIVSAQPCFFDILRGHGKADLRFLGDSSPVQEYRPESKVVQEYVRGLGGDEEQVRRYSAQPLKVVELGDEKVKAVLGATHMQFIIRRQLARQVLPLPASAGLSPEEDRMFNQRIDDAGYLHLSLLESYVVHMGNNIDEALALEIRADPALGLENQAHEAPLARARTQPKARYALLRRLAKLKWARRWMTRLYNALFKVLTDS